MINFDDPCPNCGYKKQPYLMAYHPDAPGFFQLIKGAGDPYMRLLAKWGTLIIFFLVLIGILLLIHI